VTSSADPTTVTAGDVGAAAALRDLVGWLASWTWPLDQRRMMALAAERGWSLTYEKPGGSAEWDTGLIASDPFATATVLDGFVAKFALTTADVPGAETPQSRRFVRDAFTDQVSLLAEILGEPQSRTPGKNPAAEWDLPSGAALVVAAARTCFWVLTSPKFVEIRRDLER
jgi:uncharacterized protein DUF6301